MVEALTLQTRTPAHSAGHVLRGSTYLEDVMDPLLRTTRGFAPHAPHAARDSIPPSPVTGLEAAQIPGVPSAPLAS